MCIIAIKPQGKEMISDERIKIMFANNPDGAGLMYCRNGKVVIEKGYMDVESFLRRVHRTDFTDKTVVMHFRIGTSGKQDGLNCHPFPIRQKNELSCECNLGMAHNGILHGYIPAHGSKINDTQVFIQEVLNQLDSGFQYSRNVMLLIEELIGTNKLAFLDKKGHLTLVGEFIEDDGYIFSNASYMALKQPKTKKQFKLPKQDTFLMNVPAVSNDDDDEMDLWDELEYERSRGWL